LADRHSTGRTSPALTRCFTGCCLLPFVVCRAALLKAEEEWVAGACAQIVALKPDLVVTEKGLSDLAAHFLTKVGTRLYRCIGKLLVVCISPGWCSGWFWYLDVCMTHFHTKVQGG